MNLYDAIPAEQHSLLESLIFPVKKVEMGSLGLPGGLITSSNLSHAIIINNKKIVNFCSEEYVLRTNESILQKIIPVITELGLQFEFRGSSFRKTRFKMEFIIKSHTVDVGLRVNDPVSLCLGIYNSYDGYQRYSINLILYRLVCSNGMVAPEALLKLSKSHTSQLLSLDDLDAVQLTAHLLTADKVLQDLSQYYLDLQDFRVKNHITLVDDVINTVRFPVSYRDAIIDRIETELQLGFPKTAWLIYNGFNFVLNHLSDSFIGRKAETLDTKVLMYLLGQ